MALRPDFFGFNALLGATLYAPKRDEEAYRVLSHAHARNPGDRDTADLLFKETMVLATREERRNKYVSTRIKGSRNHQSGGSQVLVASSAGTR